MRRKTEWRGAKCAISALCVGGTVVRLVATNPPKRAGANLAWIPASLLCFFWFAGDIDAEQSSGTSTLKIN